MSDQDHLGAYGFRLVPLDRRIHLPGLIHVPEDADEVVLSWRQGETLDDGLEVRDDRVTIAARGHLTMEVTRLPPHVEVRLPDPPNPEALVHPLATTPLAVLARWRGNPSLHAGAFLSDRGAYVLCGHRQAGKSTTLAMLAQRGLPIVADDLVVIDGSDVLSAPACVDLRGDAALRFPEARFLGTIGARDRYRMSTPAAPARVPLRGLFLLEWGTDPEPEVEPLSVRERAAAMHGFDYAAFVGLPPGEVLLELLALPMWRLKRARSWSSAEAAVGKLLDMAAAH